MNKNRHLIQEERSIIEQRLMEKEAYKGIGHELGKDPTTIAMEVRNHIQFRKTGCYEKPFNNCLIRKDCTVQHLCGNQKCEYSGSNYTDCPVFGNRCSVHVETAVPATKTRGIST
jgi:hypothetical protein